MIHYPVYNPKNGRQNSVAKEQWVPLLDKYGVDLVLSGHDHSYMRSKPLRAGREAAQGEPGTTYVVATGCEKFYKFNQLNIAERQFTDTATYQLISIMPDASGKLALFYSARAPGGEVLDEFHLQKRIPCHYADGR
jgi:Calcineurin-like phosphoesterase.